MTSVMSAMITCMEYDELIREALATPFEGWDFAVLRDRVTYEGELPWRYEELSARGLPGATALLDLGTGGQRRQPPAVWAGSSSCHRRSAASASSASRTRESIRAR